MSSINNIASIITVILFAIFIIGKIIVIAKNRRILSDNIYVDINEEDKKKFDIVDEIKLNEAPINSIIITSKNGIYDFALYHLTYSEGFDKLLNEEKIYRYDFLNIGHSIKINLTIPELIEEYRLTYYTSDYRKVTLPLLHNLKNGVESEIAKPKHTLKSFLYYLFK